jgi:hypothetical protein
MTRFYAPFLVAAILSIGFVDTHTDETPIILGIVLILSGALGLAFPRQFLTTWLVTGCVLFVTETLVGYGILHAPWPTQPGLPWPTLVGLVAALVGAGVGSGLRKLADRQYPCNVE